MTKEEMNELADVIVEKMYNKQKELDKEFIRDLENSGIPIEVHQRVEDDQKLLMELSKLKVMLEAFKVNEQYEEAGLCVKRIKEIENILNGT
jgi:hypothetical protein